MSLKLNYIWCPCIHLCVDWHFNLLVWIFAGDDHWLWEMSLYKTIWTPSIIDNRWCTFVFILPSRQIKLISSRHRWWAHRIIAAKLALYLMFLHSPCQWHFQIVIFRSCATAKYFKFVTFVLTFVVRVMRQFFQVAKGINICRLAPVKIQSMHILFQ